MKKALIACLCTALFVMMPAAHAATPDLAGQWRTASLKMNKIGYQLTLQDAGGTAYNGRLQFKHRDGRKTKAMRVGLAIGAPVKGGYRVTMVLPGGSIANNKGTIAGRFSSTDGSMYFPTCSKSLRFAMKGEEDTDCLFQPMPN
jgi:hypothetical protein